MSQGDLPGKCPKCHIDRPGGSIAPFRADGNGIEQNGRQHRKPWYPAEADLPQETGGDGGQQGGGGAHEDIEEAEEIGAGGGAHPIGDGAAEGDPPDGGGADDRQQGQGLRDAALDRPEGDGRQYQRKGGVGSRDDSGGSELPQRAVFHIHFSFGYRQKRY